MESGIIVSPFTDDLVRVAKCDRANCIRTERAEAVLVGQRDLEQCQVQGHVTPSVQPRHLGQEDGHAVRSARVHCCAHVLRDEGAVGTDQACNHFSTFPLVSHSISISQRNNIIQGGALFPTQRYLLATQEPLG